MAEIIDVSKPHIFGEGEKVVMVIVNNMELVGIEEGKNLKNVLMFVTKDVPAQPVSIENPNGIPAQTLTGFIPFSTYMSRFIKECRLLSIENYRDKIDFDPIEINKSNEVYARYLQRVSEFSE